MFYTGKIDEIKKLVVSDPSYAKDVWCRYECANTAIGKPWEVQLAIDHTVSTHEGFTCKGVEFSLLLTSGSIPPGQCKLSEDGTRFSHPKSLSMKEHEIGMDTACVALGINEHADEINASRGGWQPACALKTLTDGFFGNVYEGSCYGKTHLIYVSGYLDEDTGYSVEDVVQYLANAFKIRDLALLRDTLALDDKIMAAQSGKAPAEKAMADKVSDLEI